MQRERDLTAHESDHPSARAGRGSLLVASLGIAAMAPVLAAQSLPTARRLRDVDDMTDELTPPQPLRVIDRAEASVAAPPMRRRRAKPTARRAATPASANGGAADEMADSAIPEADSGAVAGVAAPATPPAGETALPGSRDEAGDGSATDIVTAEGGPSPATAEATLPAGGKRARGGKRAGAGRGDIAAQAPLAEGENADTAMVRHISALSASLNQAHRVIHVLNMEKYEAQKELAVLKQLPPPPVPVPPIWERERSERSERPKRAPRPNRAEGRRPVARGRAKGEGPDGELLDLPDPADFLAAKEMARRRQIIFGGIIGGLAVFALLYSYMDWHWFQMIANRQSLSQMAYIGGFIQMFFLGWMFFRFARIGGKGARWLFPNEEDQIKQIRRKRVQEAKRAQLKIAKERLTSDKAAPATAANQ